MRASKRTSSLESIIKKGPELFLRLTMKWTEYVDSIKISLYPTTSRSLKTKFKTYWNYFSKQNWKLCSFMEFLCLNSFKMLHGAKSSVDDPVAKRKSW